MGEHLSLSKQCELAELGWGLLVCTANTARTGTQVFYLRAVFSPAQSAITAGSSRRQRRTWRRVRAAPWRPSRCAPHSSGNTESLGETE